jgi:predicted RNA-binding protein with TRAM domain
MKISDQLQCLFSGRVEETTGTYSIEIPKREVQLGNVAAGETYRIAVLNAATDEEAESPETTREADAEPSGPPVEEGDTRTVEIKDVGDQGDGLTRVERGFVVIVPDTEPGERVSIEINGVRENVAFGEVVERFGYYE